MMAFADVPIAAPGWPVSARRSGRRSAADAFSCRLPVGASLPLETQRPGAAVGKTAGSREAIDLNVAVERAAGRNRHLAGQLIDREHAVEIEQAHQRSAVIGIEPAGQHE